MRLTRWIALLALLACTTSSCDGPDGTTGNQELDNDSTPTAGFESDVDAGLATVRNRRARLQKTLEELASGQDIAVMQTPTGYVLAPVKDGKVLDDKEFAKLPQDEQDTIEASIQQLTDELQDRIEMMPKLRKQHRERVKALDRHVMENAVSILLRELKSHYESVPQVLEYLDNVEHDIVENPQSLTGRYLESYLAADSKT